MDVNLFLQVRYRFQKIMSVHLLCDPFCIYTIPSLLQWTSTWAQMSILKLIVLKIDLMLKGCGNPVFTFALIDLLRYCNPHFWSIQKVGATRWSVKVFLNLSWKANRHKIWLTFKSQFLECAFNTYAYKNIPQTICTAVILDCIDVRSNDTW